MSEFPLYITIVTGCRQCDCNGHGNKDMGECDTDTGICYCKDNTQGDRCEKCTDNYYGEPYNGKQCYYKCNARGMLEDRVGQGIGSRQAYSAPRGSPARECLWIINPKVESGPVIIQLHVSRESFVTYFFYLRIFKCPI